MPKASPMHQKLELLPPKKRRYPGLRPRATAGGLYRGERLGLGIIFSLVVCLLACRPADGPSTGEFRSELLAPATSPEHNQANGIASHPEDEEGGEEESGDHWVKVLQPRPFTFPRDHGVHPEYRIEWWYFTGNLATAGGRRFGYQLTFFRTGIQREPTNPSRWTVQDLYTAHFALSDVEGKRLVGFERSSRAGMDWAGADEVPGRVWNGNWQWTLDGDRHHLVARQGKQAIDLRLISNKPPAIHDQQGLSRKGAEPGNASYYYSLTRLKTQGQIVLDGVPHEVTGWSWMDHEFSSSFLEKGQQGWDWFSIQLDDGHELMIYQIRTSSGDADPHSSGTWVAPDGRLTVLRSEEFELIPGRSWTSDRSRGQYPIEWRLKVPSLELDLDVLATFPSQEMDTRESTGIIYWEGTIDVRGRHGGGGTSGSGYLEMTGYADTPLGGLLDN